MFSWIISVLTGLTAVLVGGSMVFIEGDHDYVQGRYIGLLAVLFAASAVFRGLALWERSQDDRSSK